MRILPNAHRVLLRETTGQVGLIEHITDQVIHRNNSVLRAGRDHDVEGLVHLRHQRLLLTYAPQNALPFLRPKASCAFPLQSSFDRDH